MFLPNFSICVIRREQAQYYCIAWCLFFQSSLFFSVLLLFSQYSTLFCFAIHSSTSYTSNNNVIRNYSLYNNLRRVFNCCLTLFA